MDPILIVLGLAFLVIVYQVYSGEIMSSINYGVRKTNRKTEPVKFWLNIKVQLAIWVFLFLYQLAIIQLK